MTSKTQGLQRIAVAEKKAAEIVSISVDGRKLDGSFVDFEIEFFIRKLLKKNQKQVLRFRPWKINFFKSFKKINLNFKT